MGVTTYSFLDLSGAISHKSLGSYIFTGEGVGQVSVSMATEKTTHDVAADSSVMISKVAGNNGSISIECQQTSDVHKYLLNGYNFLLAAPTSEWAGIAIMLRNVSDGTSHIATGVSFQKVPDKTYAAQGGKVTWVLMAADIINANV